MNFTGIQLLKQLEGFKPDVYKDSAGILTVGYGTVVHADTPLHLTEAQATELLLQAVIPAELTVTHLVKMPLTQNEFNALVIFIYNVGAHAFAQSTMLKLLNDNYFKDASLEFPKWCYSQGRFVSGLLARRYAEQKLFLTVG